ITARSVALTADQGRVEVDGSIVSHAASGGSITLSASNNVVVNGTLDASPAAAGDMNGHIELRTANGGFLIGSGATLAAYDPSTPVQSDADGGLLLRASRPNLVAFAAGNTSGPGFSLAGDLQRLRSVTIEAVQTHPLSAAGTTLLTISDNDV